MTTKHYLSLYFYNAFTPPFHPFFPCNTINNTFFCLIRQTKLLTVPHPPCVLAHFTSTFPLKSILELTYHTTPQPTALRQIRTNFKQTINTPELGPTSTSHISCHLKPYTSLRSKGTVTTAGHGYVRRPSHICPAAGHAAREESADTAEKWAGWQRCPELSYCVNEPKRQIRHSFSTR